MHRHLILLMAVYSSIRLHPRLTYDTSIHSNPVATWPSSIYNHPKLLARYNGQDHLRRVFGIMIDRLMSDLEPSLQTQISAGVWVYVKAREVAAGDVQANAMSLPEDVRSWIKLEIEFVDLAWFQ